MGLTAGGAGSVELEVECRVRGAEATVWEEELEIERGAAPTPAVLAGMLGAVLRLSGSGVVSRVSAEGICRNSVEFHGN